MFAQPDRNGLPCRSPWRTEATNLYIALEATRLSLRPTTPIGSGACSMLPHGCGDAVGWLCHLFCVHVCGSHGCTSMVLALDVCTIDKGMPSILVHVCILVRACENHIEIVNNKEVACQRSQATLDFEILSKKIWREVQLVTPRSTSPNWEMQMLGSTVSHIENYTFYREVRGKRKKLSTVKGMKKYPSWRETYLC